MRAGTDDAISAHFIGSVVYIEKGLYQVSSQSPLLVIDGQQRLTTTMLILECNGHWDATCGFVLSMRDTSPKQRHNRPGALSNRYTYLSDLDN